MLLEIKGNFMEILKGFVFHHHLQLLIEFIKIINANYYFLEQARDIRLYVMMKTNSQTRTEPKTQFR